MEYHKYKVPVKTIHHGIISFDTNSNDNTFHIGHTVVITKKEGNSWDKIYLTYHSTDREDYPASNLINAGYLPYGWTIN
ncbi:MAG TPA: hypothetical protein GX707_13230 [Epulopiscium sp.]|nr:hypothetical protein [Candidatus Epulonipiscium sp.]